MHPARRPYAGAMLLRLPQVKEITGLSRSTIYNWITVGRFPRPAKLGPRSVAWVREEIETWVNARYQNLAWSESSNALSRHRKAPETVVPKRTLSRTVHQEMKQSVSQDQTAHTDTKARGLRNHPLVNPQCGRNWRTVPARNGWALPVTLIHHVPANSFSSICLPFGRTSRTLAYSRSFSEPLRRLGTGESRSSSSVFCGKLPADVSFETTLTH